MSEFIYGLNPAFEALRADRRVVHRAFLGRGASRNPRIQKLVALLQDRRIPVEWHEKGRLIHLADSSDHQGAVLETSGYPYVSFEEVMHSSDRVVLADNIEDPHNVGAILRSAEAFGFHGVLIPVRGVPGVYPSVVKISAGAAEHLRVVREMNATQYVRRALAGGYRVIALDAGGSADLADVRAPLGERILLVAGGENKSVRQYILNNASEVVRIEQCGRINSLNASVAAAVAMYALTGRGAARE